MVEDTKVMGYKKRPTSLRAYVGVGPYFAKSFREISPLFGGFGEISANNFFKISQTWDEISSKHREIWA